VCQIGAEERAGQCRLQGEQRSFAATALTV
jgi:hypothetical protein